MIESATTPVQIEGMMRGEKATMMALADLLGLRRTPYQIEIDPPPKDDVDPRYKTDYRLSRLIRYHGKRQRFFDGLHRLVLFTNAVLGSSAFVAVMSDKPIVTAWLTAIVAVVSAVDNVVGFSERARKYQEQRSRYYDVYCELMLIDRSLFSEDIFREKLLRIDRDSPPPKRVLDVISRNEEDISRGHVFEDTVHIAWPRYVLRHLIDVPPRTWVTVAQHRARPGWFQSSLAAPSADP